MGQRRRKKIHIEELHWPETVGRKSASPTVGSLTHVRMCQSADGDGGGG